MKKLNFVITTLMELFCACVITVMLFFLYDSAVIQKRAKADTYSDIKPVVEEEFSLEQLQTINPDVVGWITIDDTNIDYPVLQGSPDYTYLNRDLYGNSCLTGSIYIGSFASWSDDYIIMYGHHMSGGLMFGNLDYFRDENYLLSHQTGTLITSDTLYSITPLFTDEIDAYDNLYINTDLETLQERYDLPDGKYLILSTCLGEGTDRLILITKLEEI